MQSHTIQKDDGNITPKTRVGRGGKRGKTCGHGHKGQKQHGRHGLRPEMRDFIKRLPKLRGFGKNRARTVNTGKPEIKAVSIESIASMSGTVSPATLVEVGILKKRGAKLPKVKILSGNDVKFALKAKLTVEGCQVSATTKETIEKAGGEVK